MELKQRSKKERDRDGKMADDRSRHDDKKKIQSTEEQGGRSWLLTDWTIKQEETIVSNVILELVSFE